VVEDAPGDPRFELDDFGSMPVQLLNEPLFWTLVIYSDLQSLSILVDRLVDWVKTLPAISAEKQAEALEISADLAHFAGRLVDRANLIPDAPASESK
jgi:hypothetical protein